MSGSRADLELDQLCRVAIGAARAAGEVVLSALGSASDIVAKAPGDWVSATDTASERVARATLRDGAPHISVYGEEEGGARADVEWLVDPLDGTANFLHGFPVVGVSIALVVDGRPVVGVVHAPMLDQLYWATEGGGAWSDDQPVRVSTRSVAEAICATGFPFRKKHERLDEYFPVFERALRTFEDLRRAGAASLDLAWTGAGVFDGYFEQALGPWDVAAGAVIVREAGGVVTDWKGDADAWLASGDIVAAPPVIHERILGLIAEG
jgi:myo-inositol-1(or 4)-monophosphatase